MKKWKLLAISDTHLGEDTSLLSFPRGLQHLWMTLRDQLGEGAQVDEMILLGDIPDRTLSSTAQIVTHTNAFIQTLGSALNIKKGVYIPGNHEHTLWTNYVVSKSGGNIRHEVTKPDGDPIIEKGVRKDKNKCADELLSIFFGYPHGSSWRDIENKRNFDFVVANPIYATKAGKREYVFTHGTHFREDVSSPLLLKKILDGIQLDWILGRIDIEPGGDVRKAKDIDSLERFAAPFVDSLWPSSQNNPTSFSDQTWFMLSTLSGKFGKRRPIPSNNRLIAWADLPSVEPDIVERLTEKGGIHDSIDRCQNYFLPHMISHLKNNKFGCMNMSLVYGDTHDGGWGIISQGAASEIRVYNTGGWVVHNRENHPACHLFAVDEAGEEYILDVSFKDVMSGNESLLEIAERDAENRYLRTGRIPRALAGVIK